VEKVGEEGQVVKEERKKWAHVTCVNWIRDIWFEDERKCRIFDQIADEDFGCRCSVCKGEHGVCISCDFKDCMYRFHVKCGVRVKVIKEDMEEFVDPEMEDSYLLF
jgi:hypothetical protein